MRAPLALLAAVAVPALAGMVTPAAAWSRHWPQEPRFGYVTAESRYSSATITAPVRVDARGQRQVQLPGGTWIDCRQTCTNTLRQETIDFWYIRNNPLNAGGDDGPGYLTFQFRW